jgi:hypothetical protein
MIPQLFSMARNRIILHDAMITGEYYIIATEFKQIQDSGIQLCSDAGWHNWIC